jgi:hypothetical protein
VLQYRSRKLSSLGEVFGNSGKRKISFEHFKNKKTKWKNMNHIKDGDYHLSFTKQRILHMWEQEKKRLHYLLPLADNYMDCLTLGYQMMSRMEVLLYRGYQEDHPGKKPYMIDVIYWMEDQGWNEISNEFMYLLDQSKDYNQAHQEG